MVKLGLGATLGLSGIAIIGVLAFVFRDKISDFFSKITGGAETVANLGETSNILSENLLGNLTGTQDLLNNLTKTITEFKFPDFSNLFNQNGGGVDPTIPPTFDLSEFEKQQALDALEINRLRSQLENDLFDIPASEDISGSEFASARNANEFRARQEAQLQQALNPGVQTGLQTGQQFQGGGLSFIGGSVSEIPIDRLSLGGIIDRFNVTASQASDIRARALDDFGGFDFGTNTGDALDPFIQSQLSNQGQVSNQAFQGLSAQEIALRLTGGNISNF